MNSVSEDQRLSALQEYNVIEQDMKEELSGLTQLASSICNTPISLVNVLDSSRQITKCSKGWDLDVIPREDGFCQFTIMDSDMMIVEDALEDERFHESRFVQDKPNIRFYAGVPLSAESGLNLGALCVIDRKSRSLSDEQKLALQLLAEEVMARFEFERKESELKEEQKHLKQSLAQKEMLLSEIHHRIKNELSIISGLMQLEIFNTDDPRSREVLQNSQMRIQSMASVHKMLQDSQKLGELPFHEFIANVVDSIRSVYAGNNEDILLEIEAECFSLRFMQAMPCALIINELISNAYKHAFPEGASGTIAVSVTKDDDQIELCVKDDGVGLPEDFSLDHTDSIGLMLISTLTDQLHGDLEINSEDGLQVVVRFKRME